MSYQRRKGRRKTVAQNHLTCCVGPTTVLLLCGWRGMPHSLRFSKPSTHCLPPPPWWLQEEGAHRAGGRGQFYGERFWVGRGPLSLGHFQEDRSPKHAPTSRRQWGHSLGKNFGWGARFDHLYGVWSFYGKRIGSGRTPLKSAPNLSWPGAISQSRICPPLARTDPVEPRSNHLLCIQRDGMMVQRPETCRRTQFSCSPA